MSLLGTYVGGYVGTYLGSLVEGDGEAPDDAVAPTISVTPAAGTQVAADQVFQIDLTDNVGLIVTAIFVRYGNNLEVAYDGADRGPMYQGAINRRTSIAGGRRFFVRRDTGWLLPPKFSYLVVDAAGNFGVLA